MRPHAVSHVYTVSYAYHANINTQKHTQHVHMYVYAVGTPAHRHLRNT